MSKRLRVLPGVRGHDVAVPDKLVLVDEQSIHADRAARVGLVCADADLSAEAIAVAVGESGRRIPEHTCRIVLTQEAPCIVLVLGDNRLGVC